jgi:hypothetical protein
MGKTVSAFVSALSLCALSVHPSFQSMLIYFSSFFEHRYPYFRHRTWQVQAYLHSFAR